MNDCPKCNEELKFESSVRAGTIWECFKCRNKFFVENPETGDKVYIWKQVGKWHSWIPYGIVERKEKVIFT